MDYIESERLKFLKHVAAFCCYWRVLALAEWRLRQPHGGQWAGGGQELGGDAARPADPNYPQRCSTAYDVLSSTSWGRGGGGTPFVVKALVLQSNHYTCCGDWMSPADGTYRINLLFMLCFHARPCSFPLNCLYIHPWAFYLVFSCCPAKDGEWVA